MTENDVRVIAGTIMAEYEKTTGLPRHEANVKIIGDLVAAWNQFRGAVTAVGILGGLPMILVAIIEIARFARGH